MSNTTFHSKAGSAERDQDGVWVDFVSLGEVPSPPGATVSMSLSLRHWNDCSFVRLKEKASQAGAELCRLPLSGRGCGSSGDWLFLQVFPAPQLIALSL